MKWYPELELEVCHEIGALRATLRAEPGRKFVDFLTAKHVESIYSLEGERLTVYICTEDLQAAHDLMGQWLRGRHGRWRFPALTDRTRPLAQHA